MHTDLIQRSIERNEPSTLSSLLARQGFLASSQPTATPHTKTAAAAAAASATAASSSSTELDPHSSALHLAATLGRLECVRLLLQSGYNVHLRAASHSNHSPLYLAAYNGHADVVQLLRSAGAHLLMDERQADGQQQQQQRDIWVLASGPSRASEDAPVSVE